MRSGSSVLIWLAAVVTVVALFYGMDHLVMNLQGLPLNLDLSPAQ